MKEKPFTEGALKDKIDSEIKLINNQLNQVNLGGTVPISTVDWYGKAVFVIFFRKCPFRCVYCHNYSILEGEKYVSIDKLEQDIKKAKNFIDGVVFSGGEALLQFNALRHLAGYVKGLSLLVGIETNGFFPDRLKAILAEKLVDKVFLDVKAPLDDDILYEKICRVKGVTKKVRESIDVCNNNNLVDLEIRTTVLKNLVGKTEVKKIASEIKDINCAYVIQQGRPEPSGPGLKDFGLFKRDEMIDIARSVPLPEVILRAKDFGEERLSFD